MNANGDAEQFDWLTHEHARRDGRETSRAAAAGAKISAKAIANVILANLAAHGPGTFETLAARTQLARDQVWKRLSDLNRWQLIEACGTEDGSRGRKLTIWRYKR